MTGDDAKNERARFTRRAVLAAGGGVLAFAAAPHVARAAAGDDTETQPAPKPRGVWSRRADLPFSLVGLSGAAFPIAAERRAGRPVNADALVVAGGFTSDPRAEFGVSSATLFYDPQSDHWHLGPRLPERRHHLDLVAFDGQLFALGGYIADKQGLWRITDDPFALQSLTHDAWRRPGRVPFTQAEGAVGAIGDYLVYAGGRAPLGSANLSRRDHRETDQCFRLKRGGCWEPARTMKHARSGAARAVFDGELYVFGGVTPEDGASTRCEKYDPYANRWQEIAPLPQRPGPVGADEEVGMAAAVLGAGIVVFGGATRADDQGAAADVFIYDPREDKWRAGAPWPRPRHGMAAATLGDSIYAAGGASDYGFGALSPTLDTFMF